MFGIKLLFYKVKTTFIQVELMSLKWGEGLITCYYGLYVNVPQGLMES